MTYEFEDPVAAYRYHSVYLIYLCDKRYSGVAYGLPWSLFVKVAIYQNVCFDE